MGTTFGPPTDPAYVRFLDGLKKAAADGLDASRWRWRGADQHWYTYKVTEWVLEDVGLPDTSTRYAVTSGRGFEGPDAPSGWGGWEVIDFAVPDLFKSVSKMYSIIAPRWPAAVWSIWGHGDWRNAFRRNAVPPPPAPPRPPDFTPQLNAECLRRVNEARQWAASGVITATQSQKIIAQIVAECTGTAGI